MYLGIPYNCTSLCASSICEILQRTLTEFPWVSTSQQSIHPENVFSVSWTSSADLHEPSYLLAKEAQQPKIFLSSILSHSSRAHPFLLSAYGLKEHWWQSSKEWLGHLLIKGTKQLCLKDESTHCLLSYGFRNQPIENFYSTSFSGNDMTVESLIYLNFYMQHGL